MAGGQGVQDCVKVNQRVRINNVEGPHTIIHVLVMSGDLGGWVQSLARACR